MFGLQRLRSLFIKRSKEEIIYFSVNNWFCYEHYPPTKNFKKWLGNDLKQAFCDNKWCKENKLCVYYGCIDMSVNFTIAAPRSWVKKNCPELLTDKEYTFESCGKTITKKYSDFVDHPDENGEIHSKNFDWPYPEYKESNFGCHYYNDPMWNYEEEDDE